MTTLPVLQQNRMESPPDCFGSTLWDPKHPHCAGGIDITYTNKQTGSHLRQRCDFFDSCGAKVQATRALAQRAMFPQSPPSTFPLAPKPPVIPALTSAAAARTQVPAMSQPMVPQAPQTLMQQHMQQVPMAMGHWHPAPTYQFNHGIPHYLTTPEPHHPGESIWIVLLRELVRGLFKSAGHTVSYFFDTNPVKRLPPPPPPTG